MKGRLNRFLNQNVVWKKKVSVDGFGKAVFEEETIPARKEGRERLERDRVGVEIVSRYTVFCNVCVNVGDLMDERYVLDVREMVNRRGMIVGYEVLT